MSASRISKKQTRNSKRDGRAGPGLRSLVLSSVAQALREHYGENYSDRCMQSASAIRRLLHCCGVDSVLVQGEACFGYVVGSNLAWAEFGGEQDYFHFWTKTEFGELIDLTVHQIHLAPGAAPGGLPLPAVWWDSYNPMPRAFHYLPAAFHDSINISFSDPEERQQLDDLVCRAYQIFNENLKKERQPQFSNVVSCVEDLNLMAKSGHPWASSVWRFQEHLLPKWAQNREHERMVSSADSSTQYNVHHGCPS